MTLCFLILIITGQLLLISFYLLQDCNQLERTAKINATNSHHRRGMYEKKKKYYVLNFQSKYCCCNQSLFTDLCLYNVMESVATQDTASIVGHFKAAYITWILGGKKLWTLDLLDAIMVPWCMYTQLRTILFMSTLQ